MNKIHHTCTLCGYSITSVSYYPYGWQILHFVKTLKLCPPCHLDKLYEQLLVAQKAYADVAEIVSKGGNYSDGLDDRADHDDMKRLLKGSRKGSE